MSRWPSYRRAVSWIAVNDEPTDRNPATVGELISVLVIADTFQKPADRVVRDVLRKRETLWNAAEPLLL